MQAAERLGNCALCNQAIERDAERYPVCSNTRCKLFGRWWERATWVCDDCGTEHNCSDMYAFFGNCYVCDAENWTTQIRVFTFSTGDSTHASDR